MPKVTVKKETQISPSDAYSRVKKMLNTDRDLRKLDPSYNCTFNDASLSGTATGKLFKANMTISNQGQGCHVEIIVDLPLTLALVKGMVAKTLQKKLDESLI